MRRRLEFALAAVILTVGGAIPAHGAVQLVVNVGAGTATLSAEDVESIYLGKKTLWESGAKIQPALPTEDQPAAKEFIETVLNKTVSQYQGYWKRRLFSGGGTVPRSFSNQAELLDFVIKTPGAIAVTIEPAVESETIKILTIKK